MSLFDIACIIVLVLVVPLYIFNGFIDEIKNFVIITIYNIMGVIFISALIIIWIYLIGMAIEFFKIF